MDKQHIYRVTTIMLVIFLAFFIILGIFGDQIDLKINCYLSRTYTDVVSERCK